MLHNCVCTGGYCTRQDRYRAFHQGRKFYNSAGLDGRSELWVLNVCIYFYRSSQSGLTRNSVASLKQYLSTFIQHSHKQLMHKSRHKSNTYFLFNIISSCTFSCKMLLFPNNKTSYPKWIGFLLTTKKGVICRIKGKSLLLDGKTFPS